MFLIGRQPPQAMLAKQAMHRRTGNCHLVEASEVVRNPVGAEVILLAQIQDLADDLWRRGPGRAVRPPGAITESRISEGPMPTRSFVVGLARDAKVTVCATVRVSAAACCRILDRQVTSLTRSAFVIASPLLAQLRREKRA
jgi:hypothetical protein